MEMKLRHLDCVLCISQLLPMIITLMLSNRLDILLTRLQISPKYQDNQKKLHLVILYFISTMISIHLSGLLQFRTCYWLLLWFI